MPSARGHAGGPQETFNVSSNPLLAPFRFRGIGPASMGGRLDDIEVSITNPNVIYLGYATSGVWKSVNGGVSFERVFNSEGIRLDRRHQVIDPTGNENVVYVGTGEANNRQTNSFGDGVYKIDGRWRALGQRRTKGNTVDRTDRDRPAKLPSGVRRGRGPSLWPQPRARDLQVDERRDHVGPREVHR